MYEICTAEAFEVWMEQNWYRIVLKAEVLAPKSVDFVRAAGMKHENRHYFELLVSNDV